MFYSTCSLFWTHFTLLQEDGYSNLFYIYVGNVNLIILLENAVGTEAHCILKETMSVASHAIIMWLLT